MATTERINSLGKCTLNPRGNLWLKDESKFGQKLLTKMGWKRGKGLGRNEDGITENIKVKFKGSNAGVGWKDQSFLGAQNEEFDAVLENLNKNYLSNGKELSQDCKVHLEQRCQKFRERLHYQRFVKGKEVSKYTEKDMKGIFIGKKTQVEEEEPLCEKSSISNLQNTTLENNSLNRTTTYNSSSSIADYFAEKMKKKAGNFLTSGSINAKGLNSNYTHPLLSNEIQGLDEPIQESLPNDTVVKKEKRKKSSKNFKFKKHKLSKISDFKSCLKRIASENNIPAKMKKNVSFSDSISYQEIPPVFNEHSTTSDEESAEFRNLDSKNNINEQILNKISYVQNFKHEEDEKLEFTEICSNNHCASSENDTVLNKSDQSSGDISSKKGKIERTSDNSDDVHLEAIQKHTCGPVTSKALHSDCIESTLLNITQEENEFTPESLSNGTVVKRKRKNSSKNSKPKKRKLDTDSEFFNCLESVINSNKFIEKFPKNTFFNNSIPYQEISLVSDEDLEVSVEAVTRPEETDNKNGAVEQKFSKNSSLPDCGFRKRNKEIEFMKTNVNNHCNNLKNKLVLNDHSAGGITTKNGVEYEKTSEVLDDSNNTYSEGIKRKANGNSNYNSWLESQRIAMKMSIYKSMREKIKNHDVLGTTNLLQIKGYGNWGF